MELTENMARVIIGAFEVCESEGIGGDCPSGLSMDARWEAEKAVWEAIFEKFPHIESHLWS